MNLVSASLLALALVACGRPATDTTDSDSDVPAVVSGLAGCPAYSSVGPVGTTWSWESTADYESYAQTVVAWTTSVDSVTSYGDAVFIDETAEETDAEPGSAPYAEIASTYHHRCDAQGLFLLSTHTVIHDLSTDPPGEFVVEIAYNRPFLRVPADLGPNGTWSFPYDATTTAADGSVSSESDTSTMTSGAIGSVVTAVGTFDALAVTENGSTYDVDPIVGRVRMDGFDLVGYGVP